MRWPAATRLLVAAVLVVAGCGSLPLTLPPPDGTPREATPQAAGLAALVNAHRLRAGCPALEWHENAAAVAHAHSADMARRNYFSHVNPEGQDPFDRLAAAGVRYRWAGENITMGPDSPQAALDVWLRSAPHRANIENCQFTHQGVGEYQRRWTQILLEPR